MAELEDRIRRACESLDLSLSEIRKAAERNGEGAKKVNLVSWRDSSPPVYAIEEGPGTLGVNTTLPEVEDAATGSFIFGIQEQGE